MKPTDNTINRPPNGALVVLFAALIALACILLWSDIIWGAFWIAGYWAGFPAVPFWPEAVLAGLLFCVIHGKNRGK